MAKRKKKTEQQPAAPEFLEKHLNSVFYGFDKPKQFKDFTEEERLDFLFTYPNAATLFKPSILFKTPINEPTQENDDDADEQGE